MIYFSGSISGGRGDIAVYRNFVNALENAGHRVLAGSVVSETIGSEGDLLPSEDIFDRDLGWLEDVANDGGVLVADVSMPSIGVGYEIAAARYRFGIQVICLYRPAHSKRCSAMVAGDTGIELIKYSESTLAEATAQLLRVLERVANKPAGSPV